MNTMLSKKNILNFLTIVFSILLILIILNTLIFFSIKHISQKTISKNILNLLPPEMSYFYSDTFNNLEDYYVILGDSHAFGSGDSFLNNDYDFSIGHHLYKFLDKKENFINVGFPGGGSQAIYNNFLIFKKKIKTKPKKIIYLFYEGNDLENNIIYYKNFSFINKILNKIRYYFPITYFPKPVLHQFKKKVSKYMEKVSSYDQVKAFNKFEVNNKIELIDQKLQAPPIELNDEDLIISLDILYSSLIDIKKESDEIIFVYLPAPTSILNLKNPVYFQKYFKDTKINSTNVEKLKEINKKLVEEIKKFSLENSIEFIDLTEKLNNASKEFKLYGPKDFKHFNKYGYQLIANEILKTL